MDYITKKLTLDILSSSSYSSSYLKNGLDNLVLPRLFETPLEGTFNITPD